MTANPSHRTHLPATSIQGTMMDVQLTIPAILERVSRYFPGQDVVSLLPAGRDEQGQPIPHKHRTTYGEVADRARRLAGGLTALGLGRGDRVATLAPNSFRHLEAYLGIPSGGFVLHTVNIRLHPQQIAWILNDAGSRAVMIENVFAAMIPALLQHCPAVELVLVLGPTPERVPHPKVKDYDTWVMAQEPLAAYPDLDEREAAGMCYTSGTTGQPKAVVYTHRSTVLHSFAIAAKDGLNMSERDRILPVVPMFHVNAWGIPYAAALFGSAQVYAGIFNDGRSLAGLMESEKVTATAGVPTIWMGLLAELDRAKAAGQPYDLSAKERVIVGGSAAPESMIRAYQERHGLNVVHAWGMTETHPLGTSSNMPPGLDPQSEEGYALRAKQGRPVAFVELKLISENGEPVPHDGQSMGRLLVQGPWVACGYYGGAGQGAFLEIDGQEWFDTGDISTIDEKGYMQIQDRARDLVKSGGEWISSVELENALMGHPAVAMAAIIARHDDKWDERPLALVQLRPDQQVSHDDLIAHISGSFPKWWLPDETVFVDELPLGATGKVLKRELRGQYGGFGDTA
ncbi:long-chain fatty acid--CoA ligase [Deinococcus radiophilus]|uniref:long-chain fatty acid--CoA ligase n=1 Tax=Deinococcus radiophilus TaxID=32062 RepID=UPI001E3CCE1B|nr:long-chain fatty acid--CoA ligase [Deinococcus radiophilus]UFA49816.1 long-chain fatty acid--CoA ligase [Deinococcus radiophilus]